MKVFYLKHIIPLTCFGHSCGHPKDISIYLTSVIHLPEDGNKIGRNM